MPFGFNAMALHRNPAGPTTARREMVLKAQQHPDAQVEANLQASRPRFFTDGQSWTKVPPLGIPTKADSMATHQRRTSENKGDGRDHADGSNGRRDRLTFSERKCDQRANRSKKQRGDCTPPDAETPNGELERRRRAHSAQEMVANQTRLNTSVPLVPPKPKLFFTATSIFISRAVLAQ